MGACSWNQLVGGTAELIPPFNTYLLNDFRKEKINGIVKELDHVFIQTVRLFASGWENKDRVTYCGMVPLTPKERLQYAIDNYIIKGRYEINKNEYMMYKANFMYRNQVYPLHVNIPYLKDGALVINDTYHYPIFSIIERGGLNRMKNDIRLKVMLVPITVWRRDQTVVQTVEGKVFRDMNINVKIHQGGVRGKRSEKTPLITYHLLQRGLAKTLEMYKFEKDELDIVSRVMEADGYYHVSVREDVFIRIKASVLDDMYKRRVVISLRALYQFNTKFTIDEVKGPSSAAYYQVTLGKYAYSTAKKQDPSLLYRNAQKHLNTVKVMLDIPAQQQLKSIGIEVDDIYGLLYHMFFNMDALISNYDHADLYKKKIGSLDQIMAGLVRDLFTNQFKIINQRDKVEITEKEMSRFVKTSSKHSGWFTGSTIFRKNPMVYNGNKLLAIGAKRIRSMDNTETPTGHGKGKSKKMPMSLLVAHPSHLVVESILAIPSSSPLVSGTINPYLQIDPDGNICKPDYAKVIDNVYR